MSVCIETRKCSTVGCHMQTPMTCAFELYGRLEGKRCARPVCRKHAATKGDRIFCAAHAPPDEPVRR